MNKWAKVSIGAAAVFAVAFLALLFVGLHKAGDSPPVDPPRVADYNKPGTVFVATTLDADVSVPNLTIDEQKMISTLTPMIQSHAIANEDQALQAVIDELLKNPESYIIPDAGSQTEHVTSGVSGTGFIVTSDGYIVTNAHVVKMTDDEMKQSLAQASLGDKVNQDVKQFESDLGITLTQDQTQRLSDAIAGVYASNLTIANQKLSSEMDMGVAVPGVGTLQKGQPLEIVKAGEETPGKDVAIMKVNASNLPTVQLGDDTAVKDGQQALALGYPGAATFNPEIKQSDENVKPSLTVGSVSGRKTMPGGWEVLQMDTAITHGNSGGPLFNSDGQVIGITTFGSPAQGGGEVQGFNFAVPTTVVNEFLKESNITPAEGDLTKTYHEAVDLAAAGHYSAAKDKMKEVADANSAYPYVQDMISDYTAKISAGQDSPVFPYPLYLMIILGVGAVGAAGATGFFMLRSRGDGGGQSVAEPAAPKEKKAKTKKPKKGAVAKESVEAAPGSGALKPVAETEAKPFATGFAPSAAAPEKESGAQPETGSAKTGPETETPPETEPQADAGAAETEAGAEEAAHFCSSCGHPVEPGVKFCSNCGHQVK